MRELAITVCSTHRVVWYFNGMELLFFLRALIYQDAEGKNEPGKDGDNLPLILAILRTIKGCTNAVDKTKTEVCSYFCHAAEAFHRCLRFLSVSL